MLLMVVCWHYGMPFHAKGCVSTLVNVDWVKLMYFCVNEFEVDVNVSIFSGNEQQKVYKANVRKDLFKKLWKTQIINVRGNPLNSRFSISIISISLNKCKTSCMKIYVQEVLPWNDSAHEKAILTYSLITALHLLLFITRKYTIINTYPTSNSLTQKYIHFIQSKFFSIDTQPFGSKGIP